MSMFDLKGGAGNGWNYADPQKPNYTEMIEGTVVEISNPQKLNFSTRQPEFWPDGNPVRNLRLNIRQRSGEELTWTFAPKSRAAEACLMALDPQGDRQQVNIEELLGKFVRVQTQGGTYNAQHPRPWYMSILGDGEANMVRGLKDLSQQPQESPAKQAFAQQAYQPQPVQQAPMQQPVQQQQPMQQPMNPKVQAAMNQAAQSLGFQPAPQGNAAPVSQDPYGVYDQDIPF